MKRKNLNFETIDTNVEEINNLVQEILETGDLEKVKSMVEQEKHGIVQKIDLNRPNKDGIYPLVAAASHANASIMKYLVEKGADINVNFNRKMEINRNIFKNPCLYVYIASSTDFNWSYDNMYKWFASQNTMQVNELMLMEAISKCQYLAVKTIVEMGGHVIDKKGRMWIADAICIDNNKLDFSLSRNGSSLSDNMNRCRILELLLKKKFGDANDVWNGLSMLHLATIPEQVVILLEYGANHYWKAPDGRNAFSFHSDQLTLLKDLTHRPYYDSFHSFHSFDCNGFLNLSKRKNQNVFEKKQEQEEAIVDLLGEFPALCK